MKGQCNISVENIFPLIIRENKETAMGNASLKGYLRPEVVAQIQSRTSFSAKQIRAIYQIFNRATRGQTFLDKGRFAKMYQGVFDAGKADKFIDCVFRTFAQNKNGKIDFPNFILTLDIYLNGSDRQRMMLVFDSYDINRTRNLSKSQVVEMISVNSFYFFF